MGLNISGLKTFNKTLADRSGSKTFLVQKEITEATDFRILPPLPQLNGNYFIEVVVWWINKKRYTSPETYGEPCPIQRYVDKALNSKDKDLKALASDKEAINKKSEFWIPGLLLEPVYNPKDKEEIIDFKVVDGKAKVLTCGPALMKRINKMVTSKAAQNGTPDGITDRERGRNLILSKTGQKLNTEYDAELGDEWEFSEELYEEDKIPDVSQMVSDSLRPDDYLEGVIRNYLYGEDMPEDPVKDKSDDDEKPAKGGKKPSRDEDDELPKGNRPSRPTSKREEREEEEEPEEKEEKKSVGGKKAPQRPAGRNYLQDLENLD